MVCTRARAANCRAGTPAHQTPATFCNTWRWQNYSLHDSQRSTQRGQECPRYIIIEPLFLPSTRYLVTAKRAGIWLGGRQFTSEENYHVQSQLDRLLDAFSIGAENKTEQEDLIRRIAAAA